jgi:hypothetical protein
MSLIDNAGRRVVEGGEFEVSVGGQPIRWARAAEYVTGRFEVAEVH